MELTTQIAIMSSREIAELTNKRCADVHSDIKNMLHRLYEEDGGNLHHVKNQTVTLRAGVSVRFDNRGYIVEYLLDYEHSECLVTGYDAKRRMTVIKRWRELETNILDKPQSLLSLEQAKFGLALLESSCNRLDLSYAAKLQGYRALQKAAGLPELFPDAEPKPTITKPPAPAKQPALPLIKQPMSSLTKLLERHEIRAPAQGVYIMMHRQGLVERKYKANTAKLETFWAFTEKGLRFGENVEFSKKAKQTQPRFYDERFKGLLFLLGYED